MEIEDIYRQHILDHYREPHNAGNLSEYTHEAVSHNPLCGDVIHLFLNIKNGVVEDVAWQGQGCAISQASASLLTDIMRGKSVEQLRAMREADIEQLLGAPVIATRKKCACLILNTLDKALI